MNTRLNIDHAANDARIARCYGSSQESVRVFREMNQSGYAALLRRVQVAEAREGFWPPADAPGPLERLVERVWRFVTRPEVFIVITAMSALLLGMKMIGGD